MAAAEIDNERIGGGWGTGWLSGSRDITTPKAPPPRPPAQPERYRLSDDCFGAPPLPP